MKLGPAIALLCRAAWPAAILLPATPVLAQEYQPYSSPRITVEQWQRYLDIVRQHHAASVEIYKGQDLVGFTDEATRTFYIFTTKDHPAHPAWITRQVVEIDGKVNIRQIGYFAGAEESFARLFDEYLKRNEQ
ncbi:MAG: hypothetical protein ACT4UP_07840, partial [Gammaproteobacteria bacterium]